MQILDKNSAPLNISEKLTNELANLRAGAGWDKPENADADLDVTISLFEDGVMSEANFLYYKNHKSLEGAGIFLSKDNQSGVGEGDDEFATFMTKSMPATINAIVLSIVCFEGVADFVEATNPHFRLCDGLEQDSPEIAQIKFDTAEPGDTVLCGFLLTKDSSGNWMTKVIGTFHKYGVGTGAISGSATEATNVVQKHIAA